MTDATEDFITLLKQRFERGEVTCRRGNKDEPDLCLTINEKPVWIDGSAFSSDPGMNETALQDAAEKTLLSLQRKHKAHCETYTPYIVALKGWDIELPRSSSFQTPHLDIEGAVCGVFDDKLSGSPKTGGHPDLDLSLAGPNWPGLTGIIYVTDKDIPQSTGSSIVIRCFVYLCNISPDYPDFFGFQRLMDVYARNQDNTWTRYKQTA